MAKRKKVNAEDIAGKGEMDMTPMIDVTFLLIIFFMCTTEMADAAKSNLELPRAEKGEEDDKPVPGRLVINLLKDGRVEINKQPYDENRLRQTLKQHYQMGLKEGAEFSDKAVLIRADQETEYHHVQRLIANCMMEKIWRIAFAAKSPTAP